MCGITNAHTYIICKISHTDSKEVTSFKDGWMDGAVSVSDCIEIKANIH